MIKDIEALAKAGLTDEEVEKTRLIARSELRTRREARSRIFEYIEGFYNPRRRHSALGYLAPAAFEEQATRLGVAAD